MDKDSDGFDTLLRPVHDAVTTNWEKTIKSYLEKYLEHLYGLSSTNFSEAALILQNSMKFYCKRVELLYNDLLNFIMYINDVGSREEGGENQAMKKGRRYVSKTFHNDDLKLLNFIHSENNTNINLENIGKSGTGKKSVILNPSVKIPIKSGTACQIYQSDGKELGYKDEFRLFWPVTSTGLLSEDFNLKTQCLERVTGSILEESSVNFGDSSCVNENLCDNDDDEVQLELGISDHQPSTDEPPDPGPGSPSFTSPPTPDGIRTLHRRRNKEEKVKKKPVDWGPISFNFVFPLRKLRARKVFKLPKQLINDVFEERKKRKRKPEYTENVNDVLVMSQILYQNEIMDSSCEGLKIKCNIAEKNRKVISLKSRLNGVMVNGDIKSDDADDDSDEHCAEDASFSDNESETEATSTVPLHLNGLADMAEDRDRIDEAVLYLDSALHIIAKYNALRKKISMKATELARRVSEWHESIMPALEAAESRSVFNVHEYGTKILDVFSDDDSRSVIQFDSFVKKQPKEEICRFLLASLMLANTYNVEISKSNDQELAKDCLQLRLLSRVRHHELLNENIGATAADSHC